MYKIKQDPILLAQILKNIKGYSILVFLILWLQNTMDKNTMSKFILFPVVNESALDIIIRKGFAKLHQNVYHVSFNMQF